jgi:hypothetical protein
VGKMMWAGEKMSHAGMEQVSDDAKQVETTEE